MLQVQDNISSIPQSEDDYVEIYQAFPEKASDNLQYILRERKMIKLPVSKIGCLSPFIHASSDPFYKN